MTVEETGSSSEDELASPPATSQIQELAGCGCALFVFVVIGPIVTNWLGLTDWPIALAVAFALMLAIYAKRSPFKFSYVALIIMLVLSLFGAIAFGNKVADGERETSEMQASPASPPVRVDEAPASPVADAPAPDERKYDVSEVVSIFERNQIAGAQKFEDRRTVITGKALRVREALGMGFLVLTATQDQTSVELAFDERGTTQLGEVSPGDKMGAYIPN